MATIFMIINKINKINKKTFGSLKSKPYICIRIKNGKK